MTTPLSGTIAWSTPNLATSGGTAVSADYDVLAADVALVYAKPWATTIMTAGTLVPVVSTNPNVITCGLFASSPAAGTATGVTASMHQNSPASGAGAFAFTSSSGKITPPANCPGVYQISAQAVLSTSANAAYTRLSIVAVDNSNSPLAYWSGAWSRGATTGTGYHEIITISPMLIPFNVSSWVGGTAVAFYVNAESNSGTGTPTLSWGDNGYGDMTLCNAVFVGSYGTY